MTEYVNSTTGTNQEHAAPVIRMTSSEAKRGLRKTTERRQTVAKAFPIFPNTGDEYHLTELGNAKRFVEQHGDEVRYCVTGGEWLIWTGKHWKKDENGEVMRRMEATVAAIYAEAAAYLAGIGSVNSKTERDHLATKAEALTRWAKASESARTMKNTLSLVVHQNDIPVVHDQLDAGDWLLNCRNGTVDLRTGTLREHRREELITRLVDIDYDVDAIAPKWSGFLAEIFGGDGALVEYVQRMLGYSLTGSTREQIMAVCYGTGSNGKSTLMETVQGILGAYGQQAEFQTFLVRGNDTIRNDLARMVGVRMISASEGPDGARLDEAVVKALTGGDKITARFLHKEYFEFKPKFSLWLSTNHRPSIKGTDEGIWRRIRLIPFNVTIPEERRDKTLPQQLHEERAGILTWMVQGCLNWHKNGLDTPQSVLDATGEYRAGQDDVGRWIDDCCFLASAYEATAARLYDSYTEWCDEEGLRHPITKRRFGERLTERGLSPKKGTGGVRKWVGIALRG
ncbi:MAG: phage/plasmid primase, P4 family [Candidatus Thiodiazotropha sp.]